MAEKILDAARSAASAGLLRTGMTYEEQGNTSSAAKTYLKIVADHPDSEEAKAAVERVMAMAKALEDKGHLNWARCPNFQARESIVAELIQQINAARTVAEKAPKAEELIEAVEELLDCDEYEEESLDCWLCHNFSELRKKTAELILKAGRLAR